MSLNANAIISVQNFLDYANLAADQVLADGFTIYHDQSSSATAATITVTDTTLSLTITGGANAGTDSFTLANASYDTMAELTAAITALAKGWQVVLLSGSSVTSTYLIPKASQSVYGQAATKRMQYANTTQVEELINASSQAIENYLHTIVVAQTDLREWVDGRGDTDLLLGNIPVTAVKRVAYGTREAFYVKSTTTTDLRATVEVQDDKMILSRVDSTGTETASSLAFSSNATASALVTAINLLSGWSATLTSNFPSVDLHRRAGMDALLVNVSVTYPETSAMVRHVDEYAGLVKLDDGWDGFTCYGSRNALGRYKYLVQYNAGYSTVPSDIKEACCQLVNEWYMARGRDGSVQSESLGDFSQTLAQPVGANDIAISSNVAAKLKPYMRVTA